MWSGSVRCPAGPALLSLLHALAAVYYRAAGPFAVELNRACFLSAPSVMLRQSRQSLTSVPCLRLLDFGLIVLTCFLPSADLLRSVRCSAGPALLSLLRALASQLCMIEQPARLLSNKL